MRLLTPLATALAFITFSAAAKPRDAILLSQVESLTLRADKQTSHRRVAAAPQLKCISSPGLCAKHKVDVMRCENKGSGYGDEDIQWSCNAQLPPELKLGSTDVICEGYASPDDPYVLKGSCGVEYRLALTREGEERWPDLAGGGGGFGGGSSGADWFGYVFWAIFLCVLGYILYNAFLAPRPNGGGGNNNPRPRGNNNNHFWGGGGGGGDGWDDPPPPYPGSGNNNQYKRSGGGSRQQQQQQGWRPDVWSAAAGAAAGYGVGRMGNNSSGAGRNYGSTWGGGNGGASSSRSNSSSSGSAASSSRYESTGFGSTSRR